MARSPSTIRQMRHLIRDAEREAQMVSAFARLLITSLAIAIFLIAGGIALPVAPAVLSYLGFYAVVSLLSAVFSLRRCFDPRMSLLFTAVDGISLALFIGFVLRLTGSPMSLHAAVPGFVFFFCILILATMRYTSGPTLVAFASFAATWALAAQLFDSPAATGAPPTAPGFFFGPVQNAARWGFVGIATLLCLLAVARRRRTLEAALSAAARTANLSRYLPDRIADMVATQGIDALSSGRQQVATVLFADIRGFTGISEHLAPQELSQLLSAYRTLVSEEVEVRSGIVDKFIGDAVMAVFGVPEDDTPHAEQALGCAQAIKARLDIWNAERRASGLERIEVTLGLHTGEVFAGAVGTERRMEFTVLGDTVNIAARLQEAAKDTASGLVASLPVLESAGVLSDEADRWIALPDQPIRGRAGRLSLFELRAGSADQGGQPSPPGVAM